MYEKEQQEATKKDRETAELLAKKLSESKTHIKEKASAAVVSPVKTVRPASPPITIVPTDTLKLPPSLTDRFNIVQLKAVQQEGVTCGYHALMNTWSMQQLVRNKEDITAANLAKYTTQKVGSIDSKSVMLSMEKMQAFISGAHLNLHNFYFLTCNKTTQEIQNASAGNVECLSRLAVLGNYENAYFVCNTSDDWENGGHWFTIAVLKRRGIRPLIIVIDSMNWPVVPGSPAYKLVKHIGDLIH